MAGPFQIKFPVHTGLHYSQIYLARPNIWASFPMYYGKCWFHSKSSSSLGREVKHGQYSNCTLHLARKTLHVRVNWNQSTNLEINVITKYFTLKHIIDCSSDKSMAITFPVRYVLQYNFNAWTFLEINIYRMVH